MTGIAELFSEYDGSDVDWFQLAFAFEAYERTRRERHRECQRMLDLRKRVAAGRPARTYSKRGRPSLGLTEEQRKQRRAEVNRRYYEKRRTA